MKAALLLSGHMRDYKTAYKNQLETIIEPNDCDIFIVTSTVNTFMLIDYKREEEKEGYTYVNNGSCVLETIRYEKNELEEEVKEIYGSRLKEIIIEEEDIESEETDKTQRPQWKRVQQCNRIRQKYELENNISYDAVIRSRADLIFSNQVNVSDFNLDNKSIF